MDASRQHTALHLGTVEHYLDAALYDHEYRRRRADVNHYRRLAAAHGGDLLELGCGTGRLLVPLLRDGHRAVGLDRSQPMLRRCAERVARLGRTRRARAHLVRADFRQYAFSRRWRLIVCPFNAMMHLYSHDDLARFLACVKAHLAPGGVFAFDVLNPDLEWLTRDPTRRWARTRFKHPETGRACYYSTNHTYDAATQIAWIRLFYDEIAPAAPAGKAAGRIPRSQVVHLAHRQIFPEELRLLLEHHGFTLLRRDGGWGGEPFAAGCESQVCMCSIEGPSRR